MALYKSDRYNKPHMTEKPKFPDNFFVCKCPVQIPAKYVKRFMGQIKNGTGGPVNTGLVLLKKCLDTRIFQDVWLESSITYLNRISAKV
jgi:hypothetical protein